MRYPLKYSQYNDCSILIEWPAIIDKNMLKDILLYKEMIINYSAESKLEVINTYNSLLIIYELTIDNINDRFLALKSLYYDLNVDAEIESKLWEIPVCYDDELAMDLKWFSKEKKLSKQEIINLHTSAIYNVFFIGFLPGFLYLGGLNSKLYLDRKTTPNLNVKKGSVGIGGKQTGIYPQNSPGGWHIIGRSPIDFFSPKLNPPCKMKAGDKVKFNSISVEEYSDVLKQVEASNFRLKQVK